MVETSLNGILWSDIPSNGSPDGPIAMRRIVSKLGEPVKNYLANFFCLGGTPFAENHFAKKPSAPLNGKSPKIFLKMGQKGLKLAFLGQK